MRVKLGASSYSWQEEYYLGQMTLEDCIAHLHSIGGTGFELLPEQMLPENNFLHLSDRFVDQWKGWMEQYQMEPTCCDIFDDYNLYRNRTLTVDEQLEMIEHYLTVAQRLGFYCVRVLCRTPVEVLRRALPLGEKYGIKLGLEIHAPLSMHSDWADRWREMVAKSGTKYAGFIPDFGIFSKRPYTVAIEKAIRLGANPEILEMIVEEYKKRSRAFAESNITRQMLDSGFLDSGAEGMAEIVDEIRRMGGGELEIGIAMSRYSYDNPKWLVENMPLIIHTHAKFYDMQPDGQGCYTDPNIDTETVVKVLRDGGYTGYFSSEYEGHGYYRDPGCTVVPDGREEVRMHHAMIRKAWNEP